MKEKNRDVPMESKEQVERIKEILPTCTEREIYEALNYCKMNSNDAAERLLSRVETEKNGGVVPMEGKEKVERIKKMVPHFAKELICEVLKQCDIDSNLAIQRLLSQETGKNRERSPTEREEQFKCIKELVPCLTEEDREGVPLEWKEQVELIKEMMPCFTEEMIFKMLEQCYIDSDLTLPGLLSPGVTREKHNEVDNLGLFRYALEAILVADIGISCFLQCKPIRNNLAELEEQRKFSMMIHCHSSTDDDSSSVRVSYVKAKSKFVLFNNFSNATDDLCSNVQVHRHSSPFFHLYRLERSSISETPCNSGSPSNDFSSPPSSAKSSVASQLHTVSLDKGKAVVRRTEDDAATTSRSNVRALRVKGPWSSHALQAASDPMAVGNNVALGSSEFLEYELFPQQTQQCGMQLTLNDLVANADQPSELRRLLRLPFLETPSVPSRSSAAESQHPRTSASENGTSEDTTSNSATSRIQPFRDPQDLVLDAPFACSRYGPIQRPGRISENCNYAEWNHQPDSGAISALPELQLDGFPEWAPLPTKANSQCGEGSSHQHAYRGCQAGKFLKPAPSQTISSKAHMT